MRQRWWIAGVAVVGIVLAVLLFPRPDTGDALPGASADARPAEGTTPGKVFGEAPKPAVDPARVRTGIKPGQEDLVAKRNRPEVVYASKLVTPFSAIRYTLVKEGSEPAKALADEIGTTMTVLRDMRLDPDSMPWSDLETKTDAMIAKIKTSSYATNDQVVRSLEKYDEFIAEYHTAKESEGAAPAPAPAAGQEGEP